MVTLSSYRHSLATQSSQSTIAKGKNKEINKWMNKEFNQWKFVHVFQVFLAQIY